MSGAARQLSCPLLLFFIIQSFVSSILAVSRDAFEKLLLRISHMSVLCVGM